MNTALLNELKRLTHRSQVGCKILSQPFAGPTREQALYRGAQWNRHELKILQERSSTSHVINRST